MTARPRLARDTALVLVALAFLVALRWIAMQRMAAWGWWLPREWLAGSARPFTRAVLNVSVTWLLLVIVPAVAARLAWRREPPPWGVLAVVPPRNPRRLTPVVVALVAGAIIIGLFAVAAVPGIREHYPSPRHALAPALTAALILATEIFYRGGMLFTLERRLGPLAVYVVLPPYVLDHLGGPPAEVLASIIAGVILGHLALVTRSVWPGFAVHASCAVTVDLASLWLGP